MFADRQASERFLAVCAARNDRGKTSQARDRLGIAFHRPSDRIPPKIVQLRDRPAETLATRGNAKVICNHAADLRVRNIFRS